MSALNPPIVKKPINRLITKKAINRVIVKPQPSIGRPR